MNTFLKNLFDYNHHCNQALTKAMLEHEDILSDKSLSLFSHIINAHHIWNCRIENYNPFYAAWDIHCLYECNADNRKNYFDSLLIIDRYELNEPIKYSTKNGEVFTNSIQDILFQIINHSTYHRGQMAMEFKSLGIEPLLTDYIFYKMKNKPRANGNRIQA